MPVASTQTGRTTMFWTIVAVLCVAVAVMTARQIVVIERQDAIIETDKRQEARAAEFEKRIEALDAADKEIMSLLLQHVNAHTADKKAGK